MSFTTLILIGLAIFVMIEALILDVLPRRIRRVLAISIGSAIAVIVVLCGAAIVHGVLHPTPPPTAQELKAFEDQMNRAANQQFRSLSATVEDAVKTAPAAAAQKASK